MKLIRPSYEILTNINGEEVLKEFKERIPILFDDINK